MVFLSSPWSETIDLIFLSMANTKIAFLYKKLYFPSLSFKKQTEKGNLEETDYGERQQIYP